MVRPWRATLAVLCAFLFVWPVLMVGVGAFRTGLPGANAGWTIRPLLDTLRDAQTHSVLWQTIVLSLSVTVASTLLAVLFAWIVARTDAPARRLVTPMMMLVLAMPPLFFAISWDMLGNSRIGLMGWMNIESWPGLIFVCSLKAAAFSYFMVLGPFLAMDRSMEEASLTSGASRVRTFFTVNVPVLAPAISGAALLTTIAFLEAFDIPQIIGLPAGIRVLPTQIYGYINATYGGKYAEASTLALILVVLVILLVIAQARVLGGRRFTTVTGKAHSTERWRLGAPARALCLLAIILYGAAALLLPLLQLYLGSFQPFFGVFKNWTFDNYLEVLKNPDIVAALRNTALLAIGGGAATMVACVVLARVIMTGRGLLARFVTLSVWLPLALPGIVLGLGMIWSYLSVPWLSGLYSTIWILLIGLFVAAVPIGMRVAEGSLAQLAPELEEAARTSGSSPLTAFARIALPLIVPSFLSGWLLTAILISGNLAVPVLLASPTSNTVSVEVLKIYGNGDVTQAAAVFSLILTALMAAGVLALLAGRLKRWSTVRRRSSRS